MSRNLQALALIALIATSCKTSGGDSPSQTIANQTSATKYIYVASGTTYAGNGVTMSTPSNTVVRFKENGGFDSLIVDYSNSPGDTPVELANYDDNYILVAVANGSTGRIDKVAKEGGAYAATNFSNFITNGTAFSAALKSIFPTFDGGWLISKGTSVEKFSSGKSRVTISGNPYINAPGGSCATSTTLIPRIIQGPGNTIVYLHAGASPNNKVGQIKPTGYGTTTDCLSAVTGATANHYPTAGILHSSGRLLVAYGNNTGPVHEIYSYPITSTAISAGVSAWNNLSVLQGISYMAELPDSTILVASMASTFNTIEQFSYDSTANTLSRIGTTALIPASVYTKSVSSILIAD